MNDAIQAKALRAARWLIDYHEDAIPNVTSGGWTEECTRKEYTDAELIQFASQEGWKDEEV